MAGKVFVLLSLAGRFFAQYSSILYRSNIYARYLHILLGFRPVAYMIPVVSVHNPCGPAEVARYRRGAQKKGTIDVNVA
jgi:hypothetical protein